MFIFLLEPGIYAVGNGLKVWMHIVVSFEIWSCNFAGMAELFFILRYLIVRKTMRERTYRFEDARSCLE